MVYYAIGIIALGICFLLLISGIGLEDKESGYVTVFFLFGGAYMIIATWMKKNTV